MNDIVVTSDLFEAPGSRHPRRLSGKFGERLRIAEIANFPNCPAAFAGARQLSDDLAFPFADDICRASDIATLFEMAGKKR